MRGVGSKSTRHEASGDAVREALRQGFAREAEAQRDQVPSAQSVLLVARFEEQVRRRARADALLAWMRPLLLSALAGLLAIWWDRIATAPLDVALATEPLVQAIGLAALLFAMVLGWTRVLLRAG